MDTKNVAKLIIDFWKFLKSFVIKKNSHRIVLKFLENIHPCIQDINALQLEYLLEDQHYFIVSPRDMFFGKPRDEDDHLDWLLLQENVSFTF